jgi:neutral ceramidase
MLKAGTACVDITPPEGVELAGYPHYSRENTGIHDPLYATGLYLKSRDTEICLVTLDVLFFSKVHVREVRKMAEEECGIAGNHIMISASHTHSGPWAAGRLDIESLEKGAGEPKEYVDSLVKKIVGIIRKAKEGAWDAEFSSGIAVCGAESGVGGNRRIKGGPCDPLVSVLAVRDKKKTVRGVFVNYTLHPSFLHEWNTLCSADYPGYLKKQIRECLPQAVVGFSQGASGNQSSRYYRTGETYEEAERVGRTLGKAALSVLEESRWSSDITLDERDTEIEIELRSFGREEALEKKVEEDRRTYEYLYSKYGKSEKRSEYYLWQNANLKLLGSEDQLGYVRMQNRGVQIPLLKDERPDEIQLIRIGNTLVIGVQGEVFTEYALYVKAMAGFPIVVFNELTNGCLPGYLYTPESLQTGGYETDTSMLSPSFGRHLVDRILDLAGEM